MLTAKQIREYHDKGFTHNQTTREKAANDLLFYWITQWDDTYLSSTNLAFRGEFNVIRKAGRQILADIKSNPVQVDFEPADETRDDSAEIIDGLYRTDTRDNAAQEAKENGTTEAMVCGFGAWEYRTEYKTNRKGDSRQVIRRYPFYESNNQVFCDPNAKLADKSDADWWSCLVAYSEDGYKRLHYDLKGEEVDDVAGSFAFPEHSYVFPWITGNNVYYVTRFYFREKVKIKTSVYVDALGSEKITNEDFDDDDFELVSQTEKETYRIHLYIVGGGDEVLHHSIIPGTEIPVVPMYGERAFVEGEEHYEGLTRLAKDPSRLRNFQLSYMADVVSRSPRPVPIYLQEQIAGFEYMYEEAGADTNYPYRLQNKVDKNGSPLPLGAVGVTPEQTVPTALTNMIGITKEAIDDVASSNLPKDIQDMDLSGEALNKLQVMFDKQSHIYQHNLKIALRRDAQIYASMASVVYDTEQKVTLTKIDDTRSKETINQEDIDPNTLQLITKNNIKDAAFDVYANVGQSYKTQKDQSRKELKEMINSEPPDSPMRQVMLLEYMLMQDGVAFKDMRDYAKKQLILGGYKPPETDEEKQMVAEAQAAAQGQQDPIMMAAQAEAQARIMEGQAALQNEQNDQTKNEIDLYKAQTDRMKLDIQAAEAGVNIEHKQAQTQGVKLDNVGKLSQGLALRNPI